VIILGIDYGEKKSGVAEARSGLVEPLLVLKTEKLRDWIVDFNRREKIQKIVFGLPEGILQQRVIKIAEEIKNLLPVEVDYFNEELTTLDARKILGKLKKRRNYKKRMEDAVAAAIILELYLERRKNV